MNAVNLQRRIMEQITRIWDVAPDKGADLSVAELRQLGGQIRDILFDATREVCTHATPTNKGYCFDCGDYIGGVERKSA